MISEGTPVNRGLYEVNKESQQRVVARVEEFYKGNRELPDFRQKLIDEVDDCFKSELMEIYTDPDAGTVYREEFDTVRAVVDGATVSKDKANVGIVDKLSSIAHAYRLTHEEIDVLMERFFVEDTRKEDDLNNG